MEKVDWIEQVLFGSVPLTSDDTIRDLNACVFTRTSLGDYLLTVASRSIGLVLELDLVRMFERVFTVLESSHAAYALDPSKSNLSHTWASTLCDSLNGCYASFSDPVQAGIDKVTQWLCTHQSNRICLDRFIQAIHERDVYMLTHRVCWSTLAFFASYQWEDIGKSLCKTLLGRISCFFDSHILHHVWWFLDHSSRRAHVTTAWATRQLDLLCVSETWCFHIDTHLRLAAYLVCYGAIPSLPVINATSPVLHLLVTATRDSVLADILGLSDSVYAYLQPIVATWPLHAWMHEDTNDGHALVRNPTNHNRISACRYHLWCVWRDAAQHALDLHMIPDLARLTLTWFEL
jgi:hypothetical protein